MTEADDLATALLREVRLDGADRPSPLVVARRWRIGLFTAPRSTVWREQAQTAFVNGEDRIYVRDTIAGPARAITVAHEIGHIALRRWGLVSTEEERWCWRFGAALLCPPPSVRSAWRSSMRDLGAMIDAWSEAPPTTLALRVAEVEEVPTWVVQGRKPIFTRATEATAEVVDLAKEAHVIGRARRHGMRAVRLGDARNRAAVQLVA